jgi:hypothetical protein
MKTYQTSLISAGSISLDSTFNLCWRLKAPATMVSGKNNSSKLETRIIKTSTCTVFFV